MEVEDLWLVHGLEPLHGSNLCRNGFCSGGPAGEASARPGRPTARSERKKMVERANLGLFLGEAFSKWVGFPLVFLQNHKKWGGPKNLMLNQRQSRPLLVLI